VAPHGPSCHLSQSSLSASSPRHCGRSKGTSRQVAAGCPLCRTCVCTSSISARSRLCKLTWTYTGCGSAEKQASSNGTADQLLKANHDSVPPPAGRQALVEPPGHSGEARGCCPPAAALARTLGLCWPSSAECAPAQGSVDQVYIIWCAPAKTCSRRSERNHREVEVNFRMAMRFA